VQANLARIARQSLLKVQADITRSLSYYRTTLGGKDPSRILISGGMVAMPYLAEFLIEKLQKETAPFNPLEGIVLTQEGAAFAESNPGNMGELVGGALELLPESHTPVNLLPPVLASKRALARRLPFLATAAVILLSTLGAWCFYAHNATEFTRQETEKLALATANESQISSQLKKLQDEGVIKLTQIAERTNKRTGEKTPVYKLNKEIVMEPTAEEAMSAIFGSDLNPKGGIVIQDFGPEHFTQNGNNVEVDCHAVITNKDEIPESHLMVWQIRNDSTRTNPIPGLRTLAATLTRGIGKKGTKDVILVDQYGNVVTNPNIKP
jgi:hypothetical protein